MKTSTALFAAAVIVASACAPPASGAAANPFSVLQLTPFAAFFAPLAPSTAAPGEPARSSGPSVERFRRQAVDYRTPYAAGTVVIDTPNTYLYYVLGDGKALRYGIGVGREGFTWSGVQAISRKAEWPDWTPPEVMLRRQPYLPRFVAGGPHSPLGARAMYLGGTIYRIHGTNQPETIGSRVSSGCIRLTNDDVIDLYDRVKLGAKVVVLPMRGPRALPLASNPHGKPSRSAIAATASPATPIASVIVSDDPAPAHARSAIVSIGHSGDY